jgi:hypothetical protein
MARATFRLTIELDKAQFDDDPGGLPRLLRAVAERIEITAADQKVSGSLRDNAGKLIGAYALVHDDEVWQRRMRPPVLDWALDNPRDVFEQAAGLFDKTAKAVTGRSLREENGAIYKGVVALFEDRNRVAHRGKEIEVGVAQTHLKNAEAALDWTAGLVR